jgi:hypothetical protein
MTFGPDAPAISCAYRIKSAVLFEIDFNSVSDREMEVRVERSSGEPADPETTSTVSLRGASNNRTDTLVASGLIVSSNVSNPG